MQVAGEGERRPRTQSTEAEVAGKRGRPDDAERRGPRTARWHLEGHVDGRTHVGAHLMERRVAQSDLPVTVRGVTVDRRDKQRAADGFPGDGRTLTPLIDTSSLVPTMIAVTA